MYCLIALEATRAIEPNPAAVAPSTRQLDRHDNSQDLRDQAEENSDSNSLTSTCFDNILPYSSLRF